MSAWIDAKVQKPTAADADPQGCVIAWHRYNGMMVTGWHQFGDNPYFTHWAPPMPPPETKEE